jgi:pimeloyl-ACP methyl ester carboxylesterase
VNACKQRAVGLVALLLAAPSVSADESPKKSPKAEGQYATVNGLKMYYEVHGKGRPLVFLHGAFGWATFPPELAKNRQVIAVELQAHGHTADIDRPLTYENMADDVAALLKHLKIDQADVFGYSMGGTAGLALAIRHPQLVRKLAIYGSHAGSAADAYEPAAAKQLLNLPADFAPPILKDAYLQRAPDAKQWPALVAKIKNLSAEFKGFSREQLKSIKAPVLIALGDRDGVRPEHVVEMYPLIPNSQLAILPKADHFILFTAPQRLVPTIVAFCDS